jgi:N-acetylmuramoyl-L-alanine amidase
MYTVKWLKGDYRDRQREANSLNAVLYVEHHFNSSANQSADYTCVVVGSNAGRISREFGQLYAKYVSQEFDCKIGGTNGLLIGGFQGRGDSNIKHTNMPAVLLEPLFVSNPKRAEEVRSEEGQNKLARCLVACIHHFFPNGGLIAFSVGHRYKKSNPKDEGAAVFGGGTEAQFAEIVLKKAEALLNA